MELRWIADMCFEITAATGTMITNPVPEYVPTAEHSPDSTVVTVSHAGAVNDGTDRWRAHAHVLDGPGEYEISGLAIRGVPTALGDAGDPSAINTIYVLDAERLTVCHLGALTGALSSQAVQALGKPDVLITPAGGNDQALTSEQAAGIARSLEPRVVVPMHPAAPPGGNDMAALASFVYELGLPTPDAVPRANFTRNNIGDTQRLVLLRPVG
ncbi:MAG: MBL fold metallo-hydrolase, partial [Chloroflexota bacterium]